MKALAMRVGNEIFDLNRELTEDAQLIGIDTQEGFYVYRHTLFLILVTAFKRLYPDMVLRLHRSINKSTFCEVRTDTLFGDSAILRLREEMKAVVKQNLMIHRREENHYYIDEDKCIFLKGVLAVRTGVIEKFELEYREGGFILTYPNYTTNGQINPYRTSEHLMKAIDQSRVWGDILGIHDIADLNEVVKSEYLGDMINIQEALHEKRFSKIADEIKMRQPNLKVVLVTGPSSSGKTTFSKKLHIHLRVNELHPINISLDDYFLNRDQAPRNPDGSYNFEDLEALDYELFNRHLELLIKGGEAEIPVFNFHTGKREEKGRKLRLDEGSVLIVEGIHALNERLSYLVDSRSKYKIYCSPLIDLNYDNYNPVATSDIRLVRRMVRDFKFRSSSAENTFQMWPSVQRGEVKNIFGYDEKADCIFNTALIYEFSLFKPYIMPLLQQVGPESPYYFPAKRLMNTLDWFASISDKLVPTTSIIREFIGGGSFSY